MNITKSEARRPTMGFKMSLSLKMPPLMVVVIQYSLPRVSPLQQAPLQAIVGLCACGYEILDNRFVTRLHPQVQAAQVPLADSTKSTDAREIVLLHARPQVIQGDCSMDRRTRLPSPPKRSCRVILIHHRFPETWKHGISRRTVTVTFPRYHSRPFDLRDRFPSKNEMHA